MKRLLVFILLFLGCWAQGQITPNSPKAKIRVENVTLCPGQTADVAVYVDFGEYATKEGVRAMENFMFFLYLSDTSVCDIVCSSKRNNKGTGYGGKQYDYWVCEPVLKDMNPNIRCCMQNSYLYGMNWGNDQDQSYLRDHPKAGRFASTWFANESQAFMLTDSVPLFRIRIRCKKEGECRLDFPEYDQIVFSTGPSYFGGAYFDFRNGITHGKVDALPGKGPDKNLVDAGRDSLLCVGSRLTLNGEGGTDYVWTEISGKASQQDQFLAGSKTKNPTFTPRQAGTYRFQMAAYSSSGCSTLDTVVYTVGANHITDASLSPDWDFIDPGSSLMLTVSGQTVASAYPLTVTFAPDSLFAEGQNVFEMTGDPVYVTSMPMSDPNLLSATIEDKFGCKTELSSSVFIKGRNITGYLNPFPVYRCGNDNSDKSIQLNVLTRGGSGKFNYAWTATDLEGNVAPPVIDDPFVRAPRLTYQGRCAISVSIYDLVTGENVLISDTMIYRDWLHPSVEVVVDTLASGLVPGMPVGPFCEGRELTFKLQPVYPGKEPVYQWRLNGITQEDSTGETFTAVLDHDDYVDVIMYSDEECVAEHTVQSEPFGVNVRYPIYMSANVVNAGSIGEDYLDPCFDSVKYRVLTWNAGTDYTVSWMRNEKDVIYEERVHFDNEEHSEVDIVLPRTGFYDKYSCIISDASMPCAVFNSITAEAAYLNVAYTSDDIPDHTFNILEEAELLPIQTNFAMQAACDDSPITLTTDIRYLPRDFMMIWFKKPKDGGDSVFLGYYRFDLDDEENTFDHGFVPDEIENDPFHERIDFDLTYILGYDGKVTNSSISNSNAAMAKIRSVVENGFKLVLNDPSLEGKSGPCEPLNGGFEAGDAVFYVLYTPGSEGCGTGERRYRSEDFVPNLIEYQDYSSMPLKITKVGAAQNCPTAPMVVAASIPGLPDEIKPFVHYEWRWDGRKWIDNRSFYLNPLLESDIFPDYFVQGAQKDTLFVTHSPSDVKITCRAILDLSCGLWGINKFGRFDFNEHISVGAPDFTITHVEPDTIVCAGSEVTLWAQANEKNRTYKNKRKAARALAEYEYAWGADWALLPKEDNAEFDEKTDTVKGMFNSGLSAVTPSPAVVPGGYWEDWNGTDGITTYYLSVHHKTSDCWAYDSVQIFSAPDQPWDVSLEFTKQGVWCDSILEGPNAQHLVLNHNDPSLSRAWYLNGKRQFDWKGDMVCAAGYLTSDTLSVRVYTDLVTCRPNMKILKMGIPYHESPVDVLTKADPERAKVGDRVMLYTGAVYRGLWGSRDDDYVLNVDYRWQKRESDGSWTELPASSHGIEDAKYNTDTTSIIVSDYTPNYRVIAQGFQQVCPADTGYVTVPVAVPVGVSLDVVEIKSDGQDGQPIFGMCQQSDDYVKITGVSGNTGTIKDTLLGVATGNMVRVRVAPQNPGAESWVMYYCNGKPVAAGPVGSARPNPRLPQPGTVAYEILDNGEYYDIALTEADKVYVMYGTDTVSVDGLNTHYSNRYELWRQTPNGTLQLESDGQVVCPGGEVSLRAFFEFPENYGHINEAQTLTWEPVEALQGTPTGWTATGTPSEETVYKVGAVDGMNCPWTDSLRIYLMQEGEEFSVPFKMASPDSVFCGGELANALLQAYIPDDNKGLSSIFSEVTFYVCDASGEVKASVKGLDSARLSVAVQEGWKAYASAKLKAACNTSLSYSDTLTFRAVAYPVIERISPLSKDTGVCASNPLVVSYAQPQDCGFAWHSVLAPMWGGDENLERAYRVDRNTEVVFEAYRNDLNSCRSFDTVYVEMLSGGETGHPSLTLSASADVSCGEKDSVTYTLETRNCDTIVWYLNGVEAARDVLSLTFVPRYSGLTGAPDTVQVYGSRAANVCAEQASAWSNQVITRRVEKPEITYITPDTTVVQDSTLMLVAAATVRDGEPASYLWIKGEDEEVSEQASFSFKVTEPAIYRVVVYQEAVVKLSETCLSIAKVEVSMKPGGGDDPDPIRPLPLLPDLSLSSSAQWLCGEDSVINYTLSEVAGYDTIVWFENGLEIARNVWQLNHTLAFTGFGRADTVFVRGIAVDSLAPDRDTIRYRTSNVVAVHRIEKPVFVYVSPRDTSVAAGADVLLSALATAPDGPEIVYFWIDSLEKDWIEEATFPIKPEQTLRYYVYAEQYRTDIFECYAEDSALVRVKDMGPVKMGELEIYIPNTVIPYSQKKENTHLRVYGLNIKEVHLQVFNERSEKLYEGRGDAESTVWNATGTDGKMVPEGTYSYKATVIVVDSEGKEHTLNRQSWVQVIL